MKQGLVCSLKQIEVISAFSFFLRPLWHGPRIGVFANSLVEKVKRTDQEKVSRKEVL